MGSSLAALHRLVTKAVVREQLPRLSLYPGSTCRPGRAAIGADAAYRLFVTAVTVASHAGAFTEFSEPLRLPGHALHARSAGSGMPYSSSVAGRVVTWIADPLGHDRRTRNAHVAAACRRRRPKAVPPVTMAVGRNAAWSAMPVMKASMPPRTGPAT